MDMAPFIRLHHLSSEEAQNPASPLPSLRRGEFVLTEPHHEGWLQWGKHKGGRTESGMEQHLGTAPGTSSVLELGPKAPAGLGQGQQGDPCTPAPTAVGTVRVLYSRQATATHLSTAKTKIKFVG